MSEELHAIGLPPYVANALKRAGYAVSVLPLCSEADILDLRGVGETGVRAVRSCLAQGEVLRPESESIAEKAERLFEAVERTPVEVLAILCGSSVVRGLKGKGCTRLGDVTPHIAAECMSQNQIDLLISEALL